MDQRLITLKSPSKIQIHSNNPAVITGFNVPSSDGLKIQGSTNVLGTALSSGESVNVHYSDGRWRVVTEDEVIIMSVIDS